MVVVDFTIAFVISNPRNTNSGRFIDIAVVVTHVHVHGAVVVVVVFVAVVTSTVF